MAREKRRIAISNVRARRRGRMDCHVVLHPPRLGGSIFSKVASIATKLFRAAYLYENWPEKTDLHLSFSFVLPSSCTCDLHTRARCYFSLSFTPWKHVARPDHVAFCAFLALSRIPSDMAGRAGKSYLPRRVADSAPFQSRP